MQSAATTMLGPTATVGRWVASNPKGHLERLVLYTDDHSFLPGGAESFREVKNLHFSVG